MASSRKIADGGMWNQATWSQVRRRVIAMAGVDPHCAICGRPIDLHAKRYASNSPEVDHIIPISRGGQPYDIDNLQLVCLRCNRKKGKKMDGDYAESGAEVPIPLSNPW